MKNDDQMELRFNDTQPFGPVIRRQRRLIRARWWFSQMRQVVNCAMDWPSQPAVRPEQTYMALGRGRF